MANVMTLEFAGDADSLQKASKKAVKATDDVAAGAKDAGAAFDSSGKDTDKYLDKIGKLGSGLDGISGAFDNAGAAVQGLADLQSAGANKAQELARAANDVRQATEDMAQAERDAKQATIDSAQAKVDLRQSLFDQVNAQEAYTQAVKDHGRSSKEAVQASIDLAQAGVDVKQAQEDTAQATRDLAQASIDAEGGQLDLNEAQKEAHPPELQQWADKLNLVTPLLSGLTAVVGLATAGQWLLNAATIAWPVVWIVVAIAAVVAGIVLLVKHWDVVKRAGAAAWDWIKDAASNTWDFLKKIPGWIGTAFRAIANVITWPFRAAFNGIANMWNHTVGALSWSVPGWIPGIGGNHIGVPNIPTFHAGGKVPNVPGGQMTALLQSGETVSRGGGATVIEIRSGGTTLDDALVEILSRAVRVRGGNVQVALGGRNA